METIPKSECIKIGFLQKPHGIQGEIVLNYQEGFEETIVESSVFFIDVEGLLVPFFLEDEIRYRGTSSAILKFEWIDSDAEAKRICGNHVFIKAEDLILTDNKQPVDLLGYLAIDKSEGELGEILRIDDYSGNVVFTVRFGTEEILIPFNDDLVQSIDHQNRKVYVDLPDGLIDLA